MSSENTPPDWIALLGALIISLISGFISIAQRIDRGHRVTILWVTSEFLAAMLSGYLMYNAYPSLEGDLPGWITMPIAVAFSAHVGGRSFQAFEKYVSKRFNDHLDRR